MDSEYGGNTFQCSYAYHHVYRVFLHTVHIKVKILFQIKNSKIWHPDRTADYNPVLNPIQGLVSYLGCSFDFTIGPSQLDLPNSDSSRVFSYTLNCFVFNSSNIVINVDPFVDINFHLDI